MLVQVSIILISEDGPHFA